MKRAKVLLNGKFAGMLWSDGHSFFFEYDPTYASDPDSMPIGYSFPLHIRKYESSMLFPFFQNLLSEGWLLRLQSQAQRIDEMDYFEMLINNGEDLVGAVSVVRDSL